MARWRPAREDGGEVSGGAKEWVWWPAVLRRQRHGDLTDGGWSAVGRQRQRGAQTRAASDIGGQNGTAVGTGGRSVLYCAGAHVTVLLRLMVPAGDGALMRGPRRGKRRRTGGTPGRIISKLKTLLNLNS
jgi:hypothetical protein